jgi:hypothetical protein
MVVYETVYGSLMDYVCVCVILLQTNSLSASDSLNLSASAVCVRTFTRDGLSQNNIHYFNKWTFSSRQ